MSEEIQFTCEQCGKHFDPDPETILEARWEIADMPSWEADKLEEEGRILTPEMLMEASEEELANYGITPEMKKQMMVGANVNGAICICIECQNKLAEEQIQ